MDLQAVARAYRLGQSKPIHVIKFVCANTVEGSIYRRALKKMRMADRMCNFARRVGGGDDKSYDDCGTSLLDIIQFGLHQLMETFSSESEDALIKPLEEGLIEHILFRIMVQQVEENVAPGLNDDKLLESGGDFCSCS